MKKVFALLLSVAMVICMMPTVAFAAPEDQQTLTIAGLDSADGAKVTVKVGEEASAQPVDPEADGTYKIDPAANVTVTVETPATHTFKGWTADEDSGLTLENAEEAEITFTMPEKDVTLTASFEEKAAECTHEITEVQGKAATCTEEGTKVHYTCSKCKKLFSDEVGTTEVTAESLVIPATGHDMTKTEAVDADCTNAGNIEYYTCKNCSKLFSDAKGETEITEKDTVIDALGHVMVTVKAVKSTCLVQGNNEYYYCAQCDGYFKDTKGETATTADAEKLDKADHTYDSKAWSKDGTNHWHECTVCHAKVEEATHDPSDGTCSTCGWDSAAPHTHNLTEVKAKDPTCTEAGNEAYYTCNGCDTWFKDAEGTTEITDKATVITNPTGHTYDMSEWKNDDTNHWVECTCGDKDYVAAHVASDWIIDQEATSSTAGKKHKECTVCGYETASEVIPATGGNQGGGGSYVPIVTDPLPTTKTESTNAVQNYVKPADYEDAEAAEIKAIMDKAAEDIKNAKTAEEVKAIEAAAKEAIDKIDTAEEKAIIRTVEATKFKATSKRTTLNGKKAIKITWNKPDGVDFDGYDIYRSTKKNSGFGKTPFFTTTKQTYTNNKGLEAGKTYYYKVRGFKYVNGRKVYTEYSYKAIRTMK